MRDELSARLPAGEIALRADGQFLIEAKVADARMLRYAIGHRLRAVIHDDQFEVRIILTQKAPDSLRDEAASIASGHDAAHQRVALDAQDLSRRFLLWKWPRSDEFIRHVTNKFVTTWRVFIASGRRNAT